MKLKIYSFMALMITAQALWACEAPPQEETETHSDISYKFTGGRFGDNPLLDNRAKIFHPLFTEQGIPETDHGIVPNRWKGLEDLPQDQNSAPNLMASLGLEDLPQDEPIPSRIQRLHELLEKKAQPKISDSGEIEWPTPEMWAEVKSKIALDKLKREMMYSGIIDPRDAIKKKSSQYTNVYRFPSQNSTIIRAVQLPEGSSIEVIHDFAHNTYFGSESCFTADREFETAEAQSKFKELTALLDEKN